MKIFKFFIKFSFYSLFFSTLFFIFLYIYAISLPKIDLNNVNNVTIYDDNLDIVFSGNGNKEWISLDNISPYLIDATLSTEDKRFYRGPDTGKREGG